MNQTNLTITSAPNAPQQSGNNHHAPPSTVATGDAAASSPLDEIRSAVRKRGDRFAMSAERLNAYTTSCPCDCGNGDRVRYVEILTSKDGEVQSVECTRPDGCSSGNICAAWGLTNVVLPAAEPQDKLSDRAGIIDWPAWWKRDRVTHEWVLWPIVPAGRQVALFAQAKDGKSETVLAGAAALATGRSVFGQEPRDPVNVLYADYEMSADDLQDRLEKLGYGPGDDLSALHYAQLPSIGTLDSREGGENLLSLAMEFKAKLVIIDTISRTIEGDENAADTWLRMYRYTNMLFKQHEIATLRLDHEGKNRSKGQRGSSAKTGDVDLIWLLRQGSGKNTLRAEASRLLWVPRGQEITLTRREGPVLVYEAEMDVPDGVEAAARIMDALNLPLDVSRRRARESLTEDGWKGRDETLVAAIRFRKAGTTSEPPSSSTVPPPREPPGTTDLDGVRKARS